MPFCTKVCFTKPEAEKALKDAEHGRQHRKEKRMYFCHLCKSWHLSSKVSEGKPVPVQLIEPERWLTLIDNT